MAMGVMAETANTVKVTKFHQSYPYSGKATVEYTVGGTLPANAVAEITLNTDDASATFIQKTLSRAVCSSCSRICPIARELRAYLIHSIHSDSFCHGVVRADHQV